ncbi:hypothetical protein PMI02_00697, partial [Novosphingobium sp. AP12]
MRFASNGGTFVKPGLGRLIWVMGWTPP